MGKLGRRSSSAKSPKRGRGVSSRRPRPSAAERPDRAREAAAAGREESVAPEGQPQGPNFPIVAIGASAGGLDAFKRFMAAMPPDSGIAFALIPHLDPNHESLMVELLGKHTRMPIHEADHGLAM